MQRNSETKPNCQMPQDVRRMAFEPTRVLLPVAGSEALVMMKGVYC